jgi:hypothetical protein
MGTMISIMSQARGLYTERMVYNMPTSVLDEEKATLWETYISDPPRNKAKVTFTTTFANRKHSYRCEPVSAKVWEVPVESARGLAVGNIRDAILKGKGMAVLVEDPGNIATFEGRVTKDLAWVEEYDFKIRQGAGARWDRGRDVIGRSQTHHSERPWLDPHIPRNHHESCSGLGRHRVRRPDLSYRKRG